MKKGPWALHRSEVSVHIDGQDVGALESTLDPQRGQLLLVLGPTAAAARRSAQTVARLVAQYGIPLLTGQPGGHIVHWYLHRAHELVLVAFLLLIHLAEHIHRDDIDLGYVGEVEVLAPEQQIRLELHRRPTVQGLVQLQFAEVSLLGRQVLRLVDPHLQRVVRATGVLRIRGDRLAQRVDPKVTLLARSARVVPLATRPAAHLEAVTPSQD